MSENIIEIRGLTKKFQDTAILNNIDLDIPRGEIIAIVGGSGCGKTTLMRCILHLLQPTAGTIKIFGTDITQASIKELEAVKRRWGVMFQHSALFSSLTVLENVMFPLKEYSKLPPDLQAEIAQLKLAFAGLDVQASHKHPSQLSGGMRKRVALARALALDPELIFLDEPTAGLDPNSTMAFDELVVELRDNLGLTVILITHDFATLKRVSDRVIFLGDGDVLGYAHVDEVQRMEHPLIQAYFSGVTSMSIEKRA